LSSEIAESAPDQGPAIQPLEADDRRRACQQRQPKLLVEDTRTDRQQARKGLRLRAPLDGGQLLDHQSEGERGQHVQVLIQALQDRPHRHDLGDDAEHGSRSERGDEADDDRHAQAVDEQGTEHATQHAHRARRETEHARGGEHDVVGDADQCVDSPQCQAVGDDRLQHRSSVLIAKFVSLCG
jgi:hypothetical protein